jgi:phosphoglycolate phosphatase-like HAD superfamily hydrolase
MSIPDKLQYRLVSFDYDDTLVRTRECKTRAVEELARRFYGKQLTEEEIEEAWGEPYSLFFRKLLGDVDSDLGRIVDRYKSLNPEFPVVAYSDATSVVAALLECHFVGIVSACGREQLVGQLAESGFEHTQFSFLIAAEDARFHKPDPRVFEGLEALMSSNGICANEVVHVGDSLRDFLAARAASFDFIGIGRRARDAEAMKTHGARVVGSLTEAMRLIRVTAT